MGKTYEIWRGRRLVSLRNTTSSARGAVIEYLRSEGCGADEVITSVGRDAADWRGATYRAVPLGRE